MFSLLTGTLSPWLLLLVAVLSILYFYLTHNVDILRKAGIPGPTPWPIVNHLPELRKYGKTKLLDDWRKAYGNTFGAYGFVSRSPTIVTFDSKLLAHILVKDFNNFADRKGGNLTRSSVVHGLFGLNGDAWRRSRHVMSPMFTAGRLKQMLYHVNTSAANFATLVLDYKKKEKLIPLKALASKYTSDVIARVGFGIDSKALTLEEESQFAYHTSNFVRIPPTTLQNIFRTVGEFIPVVMDIGLTLFNKQVDAILPETENYFVDLVNASIEKKKKEKKDKVKKSSADMLDFLLEAEVEGEEAKNLKAEDRKIIRKEVIGNSTILILAAFETTSTALSSILYLLARHEEVQDRVIEEIDEIMQGKSQPDYNDLTKLEYTSQVIFESLRMFPPSPDVTRIAKETKTYDGITIPKGSVIFIPFYKILKDPEYFPDPYKFDPGRFSPERKGEVDPVTFLPFGYGRRQCVAKRLALMELKVVLCQLLSTMRFVQTEKTEPKKGEDASYIHVAGFFIATKPLELDVVVREK